jgi:hypothetical protein
VPKLHLGLAGLVTDGFQPAIAGITGLYERLEEGGMYIGVGLLGLILLIVLLVILL